MLLLFDEGRGFERGEGVADFLPGIKRAEFLAQLRRGAVGELFLPTQDTEKEPPADHQRDESAEAQQQAVVFSFDPLHKKKSV